MTLDLHSTLTDKGELQFICGPITGLSGSYLHLSMTVGYAAGLC